MLISSAAVAAANPQTGPGTSYWSHPSSFYSFFFFFLVVVIYLFIWLLQVLVAGSLIFSAACRIFSCSMQTPSCSMWDLVPRDWARASCVIKRVRGPAACCSKANKQARLVGKKFGFISNVSNWWGSGWQMSVQRSTPLPLAASGIRSFIDKVGEYYM